MYPTLFSIGPFTLRSFGLCAALGFLAAYAVMRRIGSRIAGVSPDGAAEFVVFVMVGGALGARLAYVAEHWSAEFAMAPLLDVFRFDRGGLMFYGGLGGAILSILLFARKNRLRVVPLLDLAAVALPLGHAFGRVGCFLNGCCYGRVADLPVCVRYPAGSNPWQDQVADGLITRAAAQSLPVIPAQLVEAALNLALFAALLALSRKAPRSGILAGAYLVSYAVIRFFTETLRSDPRMAVGPFSIAQFICLFVLLAGVAFFARGGRESDERGGAAQ